MFRFRIDLPVFVAGLAVVCWIGAVNLVANPLASAVALLIGVCYVAGAVELHRYGEATSTLTRSLANLSAPPARLADWLEPLHPGLRSAVQARIEGTRAALPGPALTPYLVGLLVLLGMFGTLLGMVVTLRGTGAALESAVDPATIRASLAAPVKGLSFAFGTSIAGVATSAALGLLSALYRRERALAVQRLDARIATTLRPFSHAHQRDETFRLMQQQADAMPVLVERLHAMAATLEQHSAAANERQLASQQAFFAHAETAYARLASSVGLSLKDSAAQSARSVGAALQPVVEATMANLARETAALHDTVAQAVQRHLDGLSSGFATTTKTVADTWNDALQQHRQSGDELIERLRASLDQFTDTFGLRSEELVARVSGRVETAAGKLAGALSEALSHQQQVGEKLATDNRFALEAAAATFEQHSTSVLQSIEASTGKLSGAWSEALAHQQQVSEKLATDNRFALEAAAATFEQHSTSVLQSIEASTGKLSGAWSEALSHQQQVSEKLATDNRLALEAAAATFEHHSASLLQTIDQSHTALQTELASRDQQRLAAWTDALASMAAALRDDWAHTNERTANSQQAICDTLARTAHDITSQTRTHANETIAEIGRLVEAAAQAPKAAADVIAELRAKLSDSMVRDTAMLDERNRLLATLGTLLDAVNHASTDQRAAIDALVATSSDLLERVGSRFDDRVDAGARTLEGAAAQITGSAVEVASLGDAFGAAVQLFGASNDKLVAHLERIEAALDKSLARSDEQLAYYVAQAREVVDLSVLSQKQIIEDLQRLADPRATAGG
jgi:hypothetical protein